MKHQTRLILFLRIATTILLFVLLILIVNFRLDLQPNRIIVHADIPQGTSLPRIHLQSSPGVPDSTVVSGQTLPIALTQYMNFEIEFTGQTVIYGDNFLLNDYRLADGIESSAWISAIPADALIPTQTHSLVLTSKCQDAQFTLFIGQNEWPIGAYDLSQGLYIARNSSDNPVSSEPMRVIVQQPGGHNTNDIRSLETCLGEIKTIPTEKPVRISGITFEKHFGRLGIIIPLDSWPPDEIVQRLQPSDPNITYRIEEGVVLVEQGESLQFSLVYQLDLTALKQELAPTISPYILAINLMTVLLSGLYFLLFCWAARLFMNLYNQLHQLILRNMNSYSRIKNHLLENRPIETDTLKRLSWLAILIVFLGFVLVTLTANSQGYVTLLIFVALVLVWVYINHRFSNTRPHILAKKAAAYLLENDRLLIGVILGIAAFLLFFRLRNHDFFEDEFQVVDAAAGYLNSGTFFKWDWITQTISNIPYDRAWPHSFLISQSFRLFGISEWSARAVSALSGLLFFIIYYYVARFFTNKRVAFLALFSAVFYITYHNIFRTTRMYALLMPLFLLLAYCLFKGLTGEWWFKTKINFLDNFISQYLNFDYRYLILSLPLLYFNYHIHYNSLVIILAVFLFICTMALLTKSKKFIVLSLLGLVGITGVIIASVLNLLDRLPWVLGLITFFKLRNVLYYFYLLRFPFGASAGLLLTLIVIFKSFKLKKASIELHKTLYLITITFTSAIFFIFIANRYTSLVYISHVMPIALLLITSGFWYLHQQFSKRRALLMFLLIILVMSNFLAAAPRFYAWQNNYGNYSTAYQVIIDNYQEDEVIFGQYLRTYYLQPLEKTKQISMLRNQLYTLPQFLDDLQQFESGWITWETRKAYHIEPEILRYVDRYFHKLHGEGVDDTMVEVYYFTTVNFDLWGLE